MSDYLMQLISGIKSRLFQKKNTKHDEFIRLCELSQLKKLPRYQNCTAELLGKRIYSNDACTLLADVRGILKEQIYKFSSNSATPLIIDCGANIGISIIYFKNLFPKSKIIAFEPDPKLFQLLEKNIKSFKFQDVTLRSEAVWVDDRGVRFLTEGGHSGAIVANVDEKNNRILNVPSVRLRNLLESYASIELLKMDIEGAENYVLADCAQELNRCKYIFVEYHSAAQNTQKLHEILTLLNKLNYRYHIKEAFCRKQPFVDSDCMAGMDLQLNLFFWKTENDEL